MDENGVARGIQRQKDAQDGAGLTGCFGCLGTVVVLTVIAAVVGLAGSFGAALVIVLIGAVVSTFLYRRSISKALGR